MDEIKIVDTTLRDGNTSLWAHNMTTGMMHPVLRQMDQAGFDAMEFFVAGASAVQLGTVNFYDPTASMRIVEALPAALTRCTFTAPRCTT